MVFEIKVPNYTNKLVIFFISQMAEELNTYFQDIHKNSFFFLIELR